jgi:hypothetical protein
VKLHPSWFSIPDFERFTMKLGLRGLTIAYALVAAGCLMAQCRDPLVTDVVTQVHGSLEGASGDKGLCDSQNYSGAKGQKGQWTDKEDLKKGVQNYFAPLHEAMLKNVYTGLLGRAPYVGERDSIPRFGAMYANPEALEKTIREWLNTPTAAVTRGDIMNRAFAEMGLHPAAERTIEIRQAWPAKWSDYKSLKAYLKGDATATSSAVKNAVVNPAPARPAQTKPDAGSPVKPQATPQAITKTAPQPVTQATPQPAAEAKNQDAKPKVPFRLSITGPTYGITLYPGSVYTVSWAYTGTVPETLRNVDIELKLAADTQYLPNQPFAAGSASFRYAKPTSGLSGTFGCNFWLYDSATKNKIAVSQVLTCSSQ